MADDTDDDVLEENGAQEEPEKTGWLTKLLMPICVTIVVLASMSFFLNPRAYETSGPGLSVEKWKNRLTLAQDDDTKWLREFFEGNYFTCLSTRDSAGTGWYGYATEKKQYDAKGNLTQVSYFDVDGKPCLSDDGYAIEKYQYKDKGNWMEVSCFDIDGNLCLSRDGYATIRFQNDSKGCRWMEVSCFGIDGKPCLCEDGYATTKRQYNKQTHCTQESYFGIDGKPCVCGGVAVVKFQYDDDGNCLEISCFGIDGKPCVSIRGWAMAKYTYDDKGNWVQSSYFDADGKPCVPRNPKQN